MHTWVVPLIMMIVVPSLVRKPDKFIGATIGSVGHDATGKHKMVGADRGTVVDQCDVDDRVSMFIGMIVMTKSWGNTHNRYQFVGMFGAELTLIPFGKVVPKVIVDHGHREECGQNSPPESSRYQRT